MKRLFTIITISLLSIVTAVAATGDIDYTTTTYSYSGFTAVDIAGTVSFKLTKSNAYKVSVTYPKDIQKYLVVNLSGKELKIYQKEIPGSLSRKLPSYEIIAEISMPALLSLEMSGATTFETSDSFDCGKEKFSLEMSGASKMKGLDIKASSLEAEISGASVVKLSGSFNVAGLELIGASKSNLSIDATKLDLDLAGASKVTYEGRSEKCRIVLSGATDLTAKGSADMLKLDAAGAAKFRGDEFEACEVSVEASGAAKCAVNVVKTLDVDLSGAAKLTYSTKNADIRNISVSGGSSFTRSR